MKISKKLITLSFAALSSLALAGCETGDDRALANGQACLDGATSTTALACKSIVAGLSTPEASMIRCSANFISQGFTGTRIAQSIGNLKNNTSGVDGTTSMVSFLIFKNADPTADTAVNDCTAAGSKSMLRLATATKLATSIAIAGSALASIDPSSPNAATQMKAAVNAAIASATPQQLADIGNTAVLASTAYCGDGSSYVGTPVCNDLKQAIASNSSPQAVATALLNLMK